jgi:DNA gyrase/topoisomerase IV subunit B
VGPSDAPGGTEVTFKPSTGTFTKVEFDFAVLERRLRELAFLNSGLAIVLRDERHAAAAEALFHYEGGLVEFVNWLDRAKTPVLSPPISVAGGGTGPNGDIKVELALSWNDSFHETMLAFTNNIPQRDGGTHLAGFRAALTQVVSKYAEGMGKKDSLALVGKDMREGMTAVLSVKTRPAPPNANLPRCTSNQGCAMPPGAACCIMGEITTRFFRVSPRRVSGSNSKGLATEAINAPRGRRLAQRGCSEARRPSLAG